jgi:hypothetical protein
MKVVCRGNPLLQPHWWSINFLELPEQGLLLCVAPLKFSVNRETLAAYSQRLRQHAVLARLLFYNCEKYLIKRTPYTL